jgi:hypothetical protein
VLDRDGINIDKIAIVQRKDKFVAWAIDINAENIIEMPRVIELTWSTNQQKLLPRKLLNLAKVRKIKW